MKILNTEYQIPNEKYRIPNTEYRMANSVFPARIAYGKAVAGGRIQNSVFATLSIFGDIKNPLGTTFGSASGYCSVEGGLGILITNLIRLTTIGAGIWFLVNLLTAGVMYIGSNGEAEKITIAWGKIWQSLIGLLIIVSSLVLTAIISKVFFGEYSTILNPVIYGPGDAGGTLCP